MMAPEKIIQKLARHYNEEIKYAIVGRGISHIDSLVELLENFDRIGPINIGKDESRERITLGLEMRSRKKQPQIQNRETNFSHVYKKDRKSTNRRGIRNHNPHRYFTARGK